MKILDYSDSDKMNLDFGLYLRFRLYFGFGLIQIEIGLKSYLDLFDNSHKKFMKSMINENLLTIIKIENENKLQMTMVLAVNCMWFGIRICLGLARIRLDSSRLVSTAAGFEDELGCVDSGVVVVLTGCRWVNRFKTDDKMRLVLLLLGKVTD